MKIYFLLEGKRTEPKVYASWLSHLVPELKRISRFDEEGVNGYFLFSAQGYPSMYEHIPNSIKDVNTVGDYNYLVVSLDADDETVESRINEINDFLSQEKIYLKGARLEIIIQNRCIETWFLGNRKIINRNPTSEVLREYLQHYDVRTDDPELMSKHPDFNTHAQFHHQYLKEIFWERNIAYSKTNPGDVLKKSYLEQLIERINECPSHLASFKTFIDFCASIKAEINS